MLKLVTLFSLSQYIQPFFSSRGWGGMERAPPRWALQVGGGLQWGWGENSRPLGWSRGPRRRDFCPNSLKYPFLLHPPPHIHCSKQIEFSNLQESIYVKKILRNASSVSSQSSVPSSYLRILSFSRSMLWRN